MPLLHLAAAWHPTADWQHLFDADALAGGPGRAEDATLRLSRSIGERARLSGGYRLAEGGAHEKEVYNFAWLHYAVLSLCLSL